MREMELRTIRAFDRSFSQYGYHSLVKAIHKQGQQMPRKKGISVDRINKIMVASAHAVGIKSKKITVSPTIEKLAVGVKAHIESGKLNRESVERAANNFLEFYKSHAMSRKRVKRIQNLIDWVSKTSDALRFDSLNNFASMHGTSYDIIKNDLYALGYQLFPKPDGTYLSKEELPSTHVKMIKSIDRAINSGHFNTEKARLAVQLFLRHSPDIDQARLHRLVPAGDPVAESKQVEFAKLLQELRFEKEEYLNQFQPKKETVSAHSLLAYSSAWKAAGEIIHSQIPNLIQKADSAEGAKESVNLNWSANVLKLKSVVGYERARNKFINAVKGTKTGEGKKQLIDFYNEGLGEGDKVTWGELDLNMHVILDMLKEFGVVGGLKLRLRKFHNNTKSNELRRDSVGWNLWQAGGILHEADKDYRAAKRILSELE